jgi:uncharacterized protein YcbX
MLDLLETSGGPVVPRPPLPSPEHAGTARALERYVAGAMRLTADTPTPLRALALTQRAMRELWSGHFDAAAAALAAARADSVWLGEPPNVRGTLQLIDTLTATLAGQRGSTLAGQAARGDR